MTPTDKLSHVRVLCVGDVMLDRFVSGQVKRISPESPVPVLSISGTKAFPGGAANVARNIASLGGTCTLVSVVGDDAVGRELQTTIDAIAGIRCAFTVIPKTVKGKTKDGQPIDLHRLWYRRHTTKFNGVSYITQRGAEAVYTPAGRQQVQDLVSFYMTNAKIIRESLTALGLLLTTAAHRHWLRTDLR